MRTVEEAPILDEDVLARAELLFEHHRERILKRTDRLFAGLLAVEWVAGIAAAFWISPRAWFGTTSEIHLHVWAAVFLGGLICVLPIYLALTRPGHAVTRHVIAVAQMLVSGLLIHLTGGRIETHFHVFGSLAFLAFYRDWRVIVSASAIVAADHFLRGVYWPQSVFGVITASSWRWLEHAAWVVFEDVFLITACLQGIREMREIAKRQASVEALHESVEGKVLERTAALRASEERFRSLSASAPIGIVQTDAEGLCTYANPEWEKISGLSLLESLGPGWALALHPEERDRVITDWLTTAGGRRESSDEFRLHRSDGGVRWVNMNATQTRLEGCALSGYVVMVQDVTERKRSEDALRKSGEQYRELVELSPEAIFIQTEGQFVFVNSALVRLLGAESDDELLGMQVIDRVHPDFREPVHERMRLLREERQSVPLLEEQWIRLDGTPVDVEVAASPFVYQGKDSAQVVVLDITQRKSLESQLRQSQKMDAIGRLAGGVAHDFNNLLTAILGYSDLLLGSLPVDDPSRQKIEEIRKAGSRASSLTRQLLAFSRRQVLVAEVLDLGAVVTDLGNMLRRLIGEDIALTTVIHPGTGTVLADRGQIEQVILNLSVNARDAMPEGGALTLEIGNVDFDDAAAREHIGIVPGRYVMVSVIDTGIGMDAETRSHIFEPFFTTKEQDKGTGLGLSTVHGIVEQSGGCIWVYSEPGHGSTFKVYLPRMEAPMTLALEAPAITARGGNETILLVEDEDVVRNLARLVLETNGYSILEATRGEEAIRLLETCSKPIDLVLTDVVMPGMNGRVMVERLLPLYPTMKVLFMSGYTDDAVVRRGVLTAGTAYLQKPFTPDSLLRKVREVLETGPNHALAARPASASTGSRHRP